MFGKITSMETAKKVASQGVIASIFIAIITTISIALSMSGHAILDVDYWTFIDVGLVLIIAFGIHKMSRIAAILGLVFYTAEKVMAIVLSGGRFSFLIIVFIIAYIEGIRGTFAYHKYKKQAKNMDISD
ncbi:hypothetical protein ACFIJ5_10950 [Haloimpatiens sp. FM7330]|uniref:hypothetical protein n=1 Tax=Haloimpatiens sp. FM7330 TaxID=3298610 RepID=UPI00363EEA7C